MGTDSPHMEMQRRCLPIHLLDNNPGSLTLLNPCPHLRIVEVIIDSTQLQPIHKRPYQQGLQSYQRTFTTS
jgi:hypothetical protein